MLLVNRAIQLFARLGGDVWTVYDKPSCLEPEFIEQGRQAVSLGLELWTGFPKEWEAAGIPAAEEIPSCVAHDPLDAPLEYRSAPTLLLAIEIAVLRGARHLKVFGADMRGSCLEGRNLEAWREEEGFEEKRRWGYERRIWRDFLAAAEREGITIERCASAEDRLLPSPVPPKKPGKPITLVVAKSSVVPAFSKEEGHAGR